MLFVKLMIAILPVLLHFAKQSFLLFKNIKMQKLNSLTYITETLHCTQTIRNTFTFPPVTKVQRILEELAKIKKTILFIL